MTRLTRAEQQQRTHEHLLDAGRQVFLRRGFLAATVEEIAADAGYTRGAVYKHFGGKEGLWLAIIEASADAHLQGLRKALTHALLRRLEATTQRNRHLAEENRRLREQLAQALGEQRATATRGTASARAARKRMSVLVDPEPLDRL